MFKPSYILAFFLLSTTPSLSLSAHTEDLELQDCEQLLQITSEKLTPLVNKNDFSQVEPLLATIESGCGKSEFTQRIRIFKSIFERSDSKALIQDYLDHNYDDVLIMRWDYSVEKDHKLIYNGNKPHFNHIPLNHPIDILIKRKAEAILKSASYSLNAEEEKIMLLFADRIQEYDQAVAVQHPEGRPINAAVAVAPAAVEEEQLVEQTDYQEKSRSGISIYAGVTGPLGGVNPTFGVNPSFGVMYSSRLSSSFIYELGMRVRINSKDRDFDYNLYDDVERVNSKASFSFGGTVGYKVFDNKKFIIAPKFGLAYETTTTGLSEITETEYYDEYYGDYASSSNVRYHNVNTMRMSFGLAAMRKVSRNQYIGIEASYIYAPYNWDKSLITSVHSNYGSLELFYRF